MPIPKDILEVERPTNTRVKKNGNRYDVIKRTCKRKDGRNVPVELGKIGEIIDGKFVEKSTKKLGIKNADIKEHGPIAICHKAGKGLFEDLCKTFEISDAKKIYSIALLRASYGNVCDRDLRFRYETSFLSEIMTDVHLSDSTVSNFLEILGRNCNVLYSFMKSKIEKIDKNSVTIVDGMLKDCTCSTSSFSAWSRKSRLKGSQDISLLYAFDSTTGEPLAHKIYPGNMFDSSSFSDFIEQFNINGSIIMGDKGFMTKENIKKINNDTGYVFPLKRCDKRIESNNLYDYEKTFTFDNDIVEFCKRSVDDCYFYSFRNSTDKENERKGYIANMNKKNSYNKSVMDKKEKSFGTIVFISNKDMDPYEVYTMYDKRWEIESYFNFYKNIAQLNNVRVQGDISIIGSEFINFLSSIISLRVKKIFIEKKLNKDYSYNQLMNYLGQVKKYYDVSTESWNFTKNLSYIDELVKKLEID